MRRAARWFNRLRGRNNGGSSLKRKVTMVLIHLEIGEDIVLSLMLAADRSIHRMGSGTVESADGHVYIGRTRELLFPEFMAGVSEDLLAHPGGYIRPGEHRGKPCELTLRFYTSQDQSIGFGFRYGSESAGPPPEIQALVNRAIQLTDPWLEKVKGVTRHQQDSQASP